MNKQMPSGDDVTQRSDMKPAFSNNLFERTLSSDNLSAAWKRVRANNGETGAYQWNISYLKPANLYAVGLTTLVLPTATNFASIWIIGLGEEFAWLIGDNGESLVPK